MDCDYTCSCFSEIRLCVHACMFSLHYQVNIRIQQGHSLAMYSSTIVFSRRQGGADPIRSSAASCFNTPKSCLLKTCYFVSQDALKQTLDLSLTGV